MARRGGTNHIKRLTVPKIVPLRDKKEHTFVTKQSPGPHPIDESMSLGVLLRDILKIVSSLKEAKIVLNDGKVKVDGKVRKDPNFPVGLMDIVELVPTGEVFVIDMNEKGELYPRKLNKKTAHKILKIKKKVVVPGGKLQLTFHDGRTMLTNDNTFKVGGSVVFDLDGKKVVGYLPLKEGSYCLVSKGRHAGRRGKVKEITKRGRTWETVVETSDGNIITKVDYLFVIPEGW